MPKHICILGPSGGFKGDSRGGVGGSVEPPLTQNLGVVGSGEGIVYRTLSDIQLILKITHEG